MSDSEQMLTKDKADLYLALARSAQQRFDTHHGVEWRIRFGLWTFFLAGAAFILTTEWTPSPMARIAGTLVAVAVLYAYCCKWLPHSHQYREECTRSRWWWEMCAWELIPKRERKLPDELHPGGWPLPSDQDWNKWSRRGWMHPSHKMVALVTVLFAILFMAAFWLKSYDGPSAHTGTGPAAQHLNREA